MISPQEAGINVATGVHEHQVIRMRVRVSQNMPSDLPLLIGIAGGTNRELGNLIEAHQGEEVYLDIFCKDMFVSDPQNERRGYEKTRKLGIPTLCCIYPPNLGYIVDEKRNLHVEPQYDLTVTIVSPELEPLSSYPNETLLQPDPELRGNSPFEELMDHLAVAHIGGFVIGDPNLRNWGYSNGEIMPFDLEASIDFSDVFSGQTTHERFTRRQGITLQGHLASAPDADTNTLFQMAIMNDVDIIARGISSEDISNEAQVRLEVAVRNYVEKVCREQPRCADLREAILEKFGLT